MKSKAFLSISYILILALTACYRPRETRLQWFLDMADSYAVEAQEEDYTNKPILKGNYTRGADNLLAWSGQNSSVRVPPEGTVPQNYAPYVYDAAEIEKAGAELNNPLQPTTETLQRGKDRYEIYCGVCHGNTGKGDGPVTPRFSISIPSFVAANAATRNWTDGKIFHLITAGRGAMKSYAAQVAPPDRWAIIHYIRTLQGQK